ncbi:MAG: PD40 domain-containing protein [Armatimonadetes bacterium]|nr:PD40 domain-containing protein [Armatimonadota bacterium]
MSRGAVLLTLALLLLPLRPAIPAPVAQPFTYHWQTAGRPPRVRLQWREGSLNGDEHAFLNQMGHWQRVAASLWPARGVPGPLDLEATFYGAGAGSDPPRLRARVGSRTALLAAPYSDGALRHALQRLAGDTRLLPLPPDDALPRFSDDGEWLAFVTWRGGTAEVWVGRRRSPGLLRISTPAPRDSLTDRLITGAPVWAPDGRLLAYILGRRLCIFSLDDRAAHLATTPDFPVAAFAWSPGLTQPIAVRSPDGRLGIVDLLERRFVPVFRLLPETKALGQLWWSPSGKRLLFRARTQLGGMDLRGGPPLRSQAEERLVLLDLNRQYLEAISVEDTPLKDGQITGLVWDPRETAVYATVQRPEAGHALWRISVGDDGTVQQLVQSPKPILLLGWRSFSRSRVSDPLAPGSLRLAFLLEDQVVLVNPQEPERLSRPYSPTETMILRLRPGPAGGYQGGDEAVITQPEPGQHLYLESVAHTNGQPARRRLESGLHVALPLNAGLVQALQHLAHRDAAVDVDVAPGMDAVSGVAMESAGGGAARLVLLETRPDALPAEAQARDYSAEINQRQPDLITLDLHPFAEIDPRAGMAALAKRFESWNWERGLVTLLVLALIGGTLWLLRRWVSRKPAERLPQMR